MLAYLESAAEDQREMVQQMLEYITDLSSDQDSPTLNAGGLRHAVNSGLSSGVATAFVHGVAATQCVDVTAMAQRAIGVKVSPQADPRTSSRMIWQ